MNVSKPFLLSIFASGLLIASAFARPFPAAISTPSQRSQAQQSPAQQAPDQQAPAPAATSSASGKIVAATDTSLSLEVTQGSDAHTQQFIINSETTVDGKIAVGATATVEFRTDGGNQIATHISVQSGS
ncbi:MAG: hypothetical protein WA871_08870 [Candidatus Acidiferrales bacterium]